MLEKNYNKIISFIFIIGAALRVALYISSPPNNSYDDHLEVINIYSETFESPGAFDCWECYQPPAYYYLSSVVLRFSDAVGMSDYAQWKIVQFINPLFSILMFGFFALIFKELKVKKKSRLVVLSLLAVLPRDLYTSAMIGNDYLISFLCVLALLLFIKSPSNRAYFRLIQLGHATDVRNLEVIDALFRRCNLEVSVLFANFFARSYQCVSSD